MLSDNNVRPQDAKERESSTYPERVVANCAMCRRAYDKGIHPRHRWWHGNVPAGGDTGKADRRKYRLDFSGPVLMAKPVDEVQYDE